MVGKEVVITVLKEEVVTAVEDGERNDDHHKGDAKRGILGCAIQIVCW